MPDLFTHAVSAYAATAGRRDWRDLLVAVVGTMVPDLAAQIPGRILALLGVDFARALWARSAWYVFHTPLTFVLLAGLLVLFAPAAWRPRWFVLMVGGGWLHILLDLMQRHLTEGSYFPFYPISEFSGEFGWFDTEASLSWLPLTLAVAVIVTVARLRWLRTTAKEVDRQGVPDESRGA
jgi:hypothetical protein